MGRGDWPLGFPRQDGEQLEALVEYYLSVYYGFPVERAVKDVNRWCVASDSKNDPAKVAANLTLLDYVQMVPTESMTVETFAEYPTPGHFAARDCPSRSDMAHVCVTKELTQERRQALWADPAIAPFMRSPGIDRAPTSENVSHLAAVKSKTFSRHWKTGQKLRVKFLNGDTLWHDDFKECFAEWLSDAYLFIEYVDTGYAEIRVAFNEEGGSWSYVGTDCFGVKGEDEPTVNLDPAVFKENQSGDPKRTILHEIGHILGCVHEHQSPAKGIEWDEQAVLEYYLKEYEWDEERVKRVKREVFKAYSKDSTQSSKLDLSSIMLYSIPEGHANITVGYNKSLSDMDKRFIAELYPPPTLGEVCPSKVSASRPAWYEMAEQIRLSDAREANERRTSKIIGVVDFRDPKLLSVAADLSEMKRVFDLFELNEDGHICVDEFQHCSRRLGFEESDQTGSILHKWMVSERYSSLDRQRMTTVMDPIREGFSAFDRINKDGLISAVELERFLHKLGVPEGQILLDSQRVIEREEDTLRDAFRMFDDNKDGLISAMELEQVLQELQLSEEKRLLESRRIVARIDALQKAVSMFDTSKDGFISAVELQQVLRKLRVPERQSLRDCQWIFERVRQLVENS